jgi:hypothetical protein
MCLKEDTGTYGKIIDGIKQFFLTKIKGFDIEKISACTIVYEGA